MGSRHRLHMLPLTQTTAPHLLTLLHYISLHKRFGWTLTQEIPYVINPEVMMPAKLHEEPKREPYDM